MGARMMRVRLKTSNPPPATIRATRTLLSIRLVHPRAASFIACISPGYVRPRFSSTASIQPARGSVTASEHIAFNDSVRYRHTIFPTDLLPLVIGSSIIGDSHFVDTSSGPRQFRHDFRFKPKPIFFNRD